VMVHELSSGTSGNVNDFLADAHEAARMNDYWMEQLAHDTGKNLKALRKIFTNERRDIYFSPQEAVDFGLADAVGVPILQPQLTFDIQVLTKTPQKRKIKP
jgi:ATP-dependent protease ClpP protease subunit